MKNEIELILLGCLARRTKEEEKKLYKLLELSEDWAFITGELIRHKINGYFYRMLKPEQRKYIIASVRQTFEILCQHYEKVTKKNLEFFEELIKKTDEAGINVAGVKGIVFNANLYQPGVRLSNDIDILVEESDLKIFDVIVRKMGFFQSCDFGKSEASKKEKLIQIMNYHDLIPYYKNIRTPFLDFIKVDVNFQFDSKENDITRDILNEGTQDYSGNGYTIRGLKREMHLMYLCVHFYREATNSIWTIGGRDVDLYKIIDIENTVRDYSEEELINWCEYVRKYHLNRQCYFSFFYLNQFYPNSLYTKIMTIIKPQDIAFLNEVETSGGIIKERNINFFDQTFDMKYGKNFTDNDFTKIF